MLDRGGLSGPADTVIAGPESAVLRELGQFRDAGATDLIISPVGAPQDVRRTLELTGRGERSSCDDPAQRRKTTWGLLPRGVRY